MISIDSLLVYERKYYLQVYLAVSQQITYYLDDNLSATDED